MENLQIATMMIIKIMPKKERKKEITCSLKKLFNHSLTHYDHNAGENYCDV